MSEPIGDARPGDPGDPEPVSPSLSTAQLPAAAPPLMPPVSPVARDRLAVHLAWEGVLVIIAGVLVGVVLASTPGAHLADILRPAGYIGLVAAGLALSLRTGAPNLAVGGIAAAAGVFGAHLVAVSGWSQLPAMTVAVAVAAFAGLVTGLFVGWLSVPAWAGTLAVAILAQSAALVISGGQPVLLRGSGSYPAWAWLAAFAVVSVGGGALWRVPAVRATLSARRNAGEAGRRAGLRAELGAIAGLTGSSLLAGLGGVALTTYLRFGDPSSGGPNLTIIALAAVLLGGVSVFGRRAGIFGTVLGVLIVEAVVFAMSAHGVPSYWIYVPIGAIALVGVAVSRSLESVTDHLNRRAVY